MISSFFRYLFTAKNEYHIHSPFVYEFYTKGVKGGEDEAFARLGLTTREEVPVEVLLERYLTVRREDVYYFVPNIHRSEAEEAAWNAICRHPAVVLTMDFYRYGYVFYREGMEKQEFVLRDRR